jgi:hypothetical protein
MAIAKITIEEKESALSRALAIPSVADDPQLRNFLEFTAEKVIRGETAGLTEFVVATEALGKPPEFDPRLDPVVRSCARRVRKKLARYYGREGASDPVRLTIHRRQYLPDFVRRKRNLRRLLPAAFVAGLAVGIVLLAWGLYRIWPLQRTGTAAQAIEGDAGNVILNPFLHGAHRTVLAVYDLPLVEDASGNLLRLKEGSPGMLEAGEPDSVKKLLVTPSLAGTEELYPAGGITGTGEALAAALFGRYFAGRANAFEARVWSSLAREEREENNVLLLGAPDMDTVALARGSTSDFRFVRLRHASGRWFAAIENLRPAAGERLLYEVRMGPAATAPEEVYALISFLPGRAPGSHWLLVAGSTSAGTLGASEYLTSGSVLRDLPPAWLMVGGQPPSFEMLVRVPVRDSRPLGAEYVLHHTRQR